MLNIGQKTRLKPFSISRVVIIRLSAPQSALLAAYNYGANYANAVKAEGA